MPLCNISGVRLFRPHRHFHKCAPYTSKLCAHVARPEGIPIYRVLDEQGNLQSGSEAPQLEAKFAQRIIRQMITVNVMDQVLYDAQRQGRISFYLTSAGEEASHIGSAAALQPDDPIYGQYREVGSLLWRGFTLADVMNQCYSNHLDGGKGRQMPVHYGSAQHRFQTISSPLGTQIPQAAGAAYALKLRGSPNVVMCYFGEGAASEGDFHAGLNIAATTEAPVIYFCRNNHYAISTSLAEQYRGDGIASRGPGYGIPAFRVDGNDLLAVYRVTEAARQISLESNTPVLIEAITYRIGHHSTSDDSLAYREREEVDKWAGGNNPIQRYKAFLTKNGLWSDKEDQKFRDEIRKAILEEFSAAEKRLKPAITEIFSDVYDELPQNLREQQGELLDLIRDNPSAYPLHQHKSPEDKLNK